MIRTITSYTDIFKGEKQRIIENYKKYVKRELTDDELEVIGEFVNDYYKIN